MTMPDRSALADYDAWRGRDAYDSDGTKIGTIEDIFYDNRTRRPEWVAVKTGFFGMKRSLAPIAGSSVYRDPDSGESHLQLRLLKDEIKGAPQVDTGPEGLTDVEEERLYDYYGHDYSGRENTFDSMSRADQGYKTGWKDAWTTDRSHEGDVVAEETVTNEAVQKVEQPHTVRLRKYQWTEQVPVQHEEVRMEEEGRGAPRRMTH
jgi:hypothetical protein